MSQITDNVKRILLEIPAGVTLVAASKMNDAVRVQEAINAGITVCGENRVQEMIEKNKVGAYQGADLHFIGHLQSNKVNKVVGTCSLIQSVHSSELLKYIDSQASKLGIVQDVLLEINIASEVSKSGFLPSEIHSAFSVVSCLNSVHVRGLMAIPPVCSKPCQNGPYFAEMHKIFVDIASEKYDNVSMDFLSMGMSNDYSEAIKHGSNMVRIGSGIFGPRNYNSPEV